MYMYACIIMMLFHKHVSKKTASKRTGRHGLNHGQHHMSHHTVVLTYMHIDTHTSIHAYMHAYNLIMHMHIFIAYKTTLEPNFKVSDARRRHNKPKEYQNFLRVGPETYKLRPSPKTLIPIGL
jgi:hypothetical protein